MLQILLAVYIPWIPIQLIGDSSASARDFYLLADRAFRSDETEQATEALQSLIQQFPDSRYATPAAIRLAELQLAAGNTRAAAELLIFWLRKSETLPVDTLALEKDQSKESALPQPLEDEAETLDRLQRLLVTALSRLTDQEIQSFDQQLQLRDTHGLTISQASIARELARRAFQSGELSRSLELLERLESSATDREKEMRSFTLPMAILRKSASLQEIHQIQQRSGAWDTLSLSQRTSLKLTLAEAYRRLGEHETAKQAFDELAGELAEESVDIGESKSITDPQDLAIELEDWRASVDLRRAQLLMAAGERHAAAELLERSLASYPEFSLQYEFHFMLAQYWISEIDFAKAQGELKSILQSDTISQSSRAKAIWMMGEIEFMKRNYIEALGNYSQILSMSDQPQWQARSLLQMGKCLELQNRVDEAIPIYQRIIHDFADSEVNQAATQRLEVMKQARTLTRFQKQLLREGPKATPGQISKGSQPDQVR